jgi:hypothetical protein
MGPEKSDEGQFETMTDPKPYNPLDRVHLGASVAEAMLERDPEPLADFSRKSFKGAGIYAIYYVGDFKPYTVIATRNVDKKFEAPIYIGKAVPAGARKGNEVLHGGGTGPVLCNRLKEHAESIKAAKTTLDIADFHCRYLVVEDIWIPLGETLLIATYSPIWNKRLEGFGNHDPGKGRYNGLRPMWDVLHPGRSWADKCKARTETAEELSNDIKAYLRTSGIPAKPKLLE